MQRIERRRKVRYNRNQGNPKGNIVHSTKEMIMEEMVKNNGERDIHNILEVEQLLFTVLKKGVEKFGDGVQVMDFVELVKWVLADEQLHAEFKAAVDDFKSIPLEALDLKMSEIVILYTTVKGHIEELGLDFGKFSAIAKLFPIVKKIWDLIKRFF